MQSNIMTKKTKPSEEQKPIAIPSPTKNLLLEKVCLDEVIIHPDIPDQVLEMASNVRYLAVGNSILSEQGLSLLLQSHPPHAVRKRNNKFQCFAGLRSYQLAIANLDVSQKIWFIVRGTLKGKRQLNPSHQVRQNQIVRGQFSR